MEVDQLTPNQEAKKPPPNVELIPISKIEVLNSRERNAKVFDGIVDNIQRIGLKKPITVTERVGEDQERKYLLVCGEGRLNAFTILGETHIPALITKVSDEDAFIMSLAENIARQGYRPLEILSDIELLLDEGLNVEAIIDRTGLSQKYVYDIVFLLQKGEEHLIKAVRSNVIKLSAAVEIARAKYKNADLGVALEEAYTKGQLKGQHLHEAKRLIEKKPKLADAENQKVEVPKSAKTLVKTYQKEVARQRSIVLKADHAQQRLLIITQALKKLFNDDRFVQLLKAERLDELPEFLAKRLQHFNLEGVQQ